MCGERSSRSYYLGRLRDILAGSLKAEEFTSSAYKLIGRRDGLSSSFKCKLPILGTACLLGLLLVICLTRYLAPLPLSPERTGVVLAVLAAAFFFWAVDLFKRVSPPRDSSEKEVLAMLTELETLSSSISRYLSKLDTFMGKNFSVMTHSKVSSHFALIELKTALQRKIDLALAALSTQDANAIQAARAEISGSILLRSQFGTRTGEAHIIPIERASSVASLIIEDLESNLAETEGISIQ